MEKIIENLSRHSSPSPTKWHEAARYRMENKKWLRYSQAIAIMVLDAMEVKGLKQKALAELMGCSQQYVSKILKGRENLSLETITKLEDALKLDILSGTLSYVCGYKPSRQSSSVYLSDSAATEYGSHMDD